MNRTQKVIVNGYSSSSGEVISGVPQGTVLGSLLFLCYINDLPSHVKSSVELYADDLYRAIDCAPDHEIPYGCFVIFPKFDIIPEAIFLKFSMWSTDSVGHFHSKNHLVLQRQHGATNARKSRFLSSCQCTHVVWHAGFLGRTTNNRAS